MFVLRTLEIRWFSPHSPPEAIRTWFRSLGPVEVQPPRTDLYLRGLGDALGIKLREGRLEIKQLEREYGRITFADGVEGHVRAWTKSSFELTPGEEAPTSGWVAIEKSRQILYFESGAEGRLSVAAPGTYPQRGGGVELTEVRSPDGQRWWTLGIEVVGPAVEQTVILTALTGRIFTPQINFSLPVSASMDYPAWLADLPGSQT